MVGHEAGSAPEHTNLPLLAFPAGVWARGYSELSDPVITDAATWLAGLTPVEMAYALQEEKVVLPNPDDPLWMQPHLASLYPSWVEAKAQDEGTGDDDSPVTVYLSRGALTNWLYENLFATLLQVTLLHVGMDGALAHLVTARGVVGYLDDGGNVGALLRSDIRSGPGDQVSLVSLGLSPAADAVTALIRACAVTDPEITVGVVYDFTPYLVGSTPQGGWMSIDRALAYRDAGISVGEARAVEFGVATNRPNDDA